MTKKRHCVRMILTLTAAALLQGCQGCTQDPQIQENLKKAVWIKYTHIANVKRFQPNMGNSIQYNGVNNDGFWAVFEICSIDVSGSALTGFTYNIGKFEIELPAGNVSKSTPGLVARSDAQARPSPGPEVDGVVRAALEKGPVTQFLGKQLHDKPGFRFAILLNNNPAGYQNTAMDLDYLGQPEAAVVVQRVVHDNPAEIPFYNHGVSPEIASRCP